MYESDVYGVFYGIYVNAVIIDYKMEEHAVNMTEY